MPSAETKLQGKNILVTAGPTVEYWDSVRYLTNRASGKTGLEIAHYARTLGAQVTLVSSIKSHAGYDVRHILISSARDMFKVVKEEYGNCDIFISSAAVADFRPVYVKGKIDKRKGMPEIKLKRNPDILKWAGDNKERQVIAGFSLQEKIDIKKAKLKKTEKNCDLMIVNSISNLSGSKKTFTLLSSEFSSELTSGLSSEISSGEIQEYKDVDITETARRIVEACLKL